MTQPTVDAESKCSHCGFPIPKHGRGLRHFGTHTAHQENECLRLLHHEIARLRAALAEKQADTLPLDEVPEGWEFLNVRYSAPSYRDPMYVAVISKKNRGHYSFGGDKEGWGTTPAEALRSANKAALEAMGSKPVV